MLVRYALLAMCLMVGTLAITTASAQTAGVQLYAAGSLREALTEVARNFETESGLKCSCFRSADVARVSHYVMLA